MKNKAFTYFLIAIVFGVWSLIVYRVFAAAGDNDGVEIAAIVPGKKEPFNDYSDKLDTSHLLLNYRDPFGLVKQSDTAVKITTIVARKKLVVIPKPAMNWSFITYSGYIRNPSSKKLIALLTINGQNITLAEGESKSQVKLLKNLRDSVKVSYQGKIKCIAIKSTAL